MAYLYFFVAFGPTCLAQFEFIHRRVVSFGHEVILFTDNNKVKYDGVKVIHVESPRERQHMYKFRCSVHRLIDLSKYQAVCYADTDVVIRRDIFEKYSHSITVAQEPDVMMDNEHFCELLTPYERIAARKWPALNAGFIVVPRKMINFWKYWEKIADKSYAKRPWIAEQHSLNWIYFHEFNRWHIKLFQGNDFGWPIKGIKGEFAEHYICLKNEDKLPHMKKLSGL